MATKLLLIEDVENLGRSGEVVAVRPGYARNLLIPKRKALLASKQTLRMQAELQQKRQQQAIADKRDSEAVAEGINGKIVTALVKVDHGGHMYGSVSAHDIIELLQQQHGISLEKRNLQLKHPIKETGVFDIPVRLMEGVIATFHLKVISEHDAAQEAAAATTEAEAPQE